MFAGDTSPFRQAANVARDLALEILRTTEKDYFDRLLSLGDTYCLETLFGVIYVFAGLGEKRAVPFLVSRLKDERKMLRVALIHALGEIGTPEALDSIETVANDKRKVIRQAVQQALGNQ